MLYNRTLIARGSLTLWIDEEALKSWHKVSGKGKVYADAAIVAALSLKSAFSLSLRATQGFLISLFNRLNLSQLVPNYTTLSRRANTLVVPKIAAHKAGPLHLAIDSTGLKVYGEGEWKIRAHGKSKRRTWRKLHLAVDTASNHIVAHELTEQSVADNKAMPDLLDQIESPLDSVYADKGYDSHNCHKQVLEKGARPVIPPRKGACELPPKGMKDPPLTRAQAIRRMTEVGRKQWKVESGYHKRSLSETAMFRYKTIIGADLKSRKVQTQKTEAAIGICVLNKMTELGMPVSKKVA